MTTFFILKSAAAVAASRTDYSFKPVRTYIGDTRQKRRTITVHGCSESISRKGALNFTTSREERGEMRPAIDGERGDIFRMHYSTTDH